MSYKERVVESHGFSLGGAHAIDGVNMIRDLEEKKTIKGVDEDDNSTILIPFHAVEAVIKQTTMEDREDKNPYYCEPSGGGSEGVCSSKVCTAKVAC